MLRVFLDIVTILLQLQRKGRTMSIGLTHFLIGASQNPALVPSLRSEPGVFGAQYGLNDQEVEAILSGDQQRLQQSLDYLPLILHISYPKPGPQPQPEPEPTENVF